MTFEGGQSKKIEMDCIALRQKHDSNTKKDKTNRVKEGMIEIFGSFPVICQCPLNRLHIFAFV